MSQGKKKKEMHQRIRYLEYQVSRQSELIRRLLSDTDILKKYIEITKRNFNYQWENVPYTENVQESIRNICNYTQLPNEWFIGKSIADVGCGNGRYSYAFCKMGGIDSKVLSVDESEEGLINSKEICKEYPNHDVLKADILNFEKSDFLKSFDLVWCYGVIHHTGDAYRAFKNISKLVKNGGYLFLMVYGEPRFEKPIDYEEINEYEFWRRLTRNLNPDEIRSTVEEGIRNRAFRNSREENIHGYFDAISPAINDLFSWEEIRSWLIEEDFDNIKRTIDSRNHHVIARKKLD